MAQLLYSKLAFDPQAFEPVSVFAKFSFAVVGRENLPIGNLSELISYARLYPGKLSWASPGVGQTAHLLLEALRVKANVDIIHIPYRGGAPALNDLLGGQVDLSALGLAISMPHIASGKLKVLGVTSRTRFAAFPDTPTLGEIVPSLDADAMIAIAAPPGTPTDITGKVSDAIATVLALPSVKARFAELHAESVASKPEDMRNMLGRATEQWRPVIAAARIRLD